MAFFPLPPLLFHAPIHSIEFSSSAAAISTVVSAVRTIHANCRLFPQLGAKQQKFLHPFCLLLALGLFFDFFLIDPLNQFFPLSSNSTLLNLIRKYLKITKTFLTSEEGNNAGCGGKNSIEE
jgi:hypothetical protein